MAAESSFDPLSAFARLPLPPSDSSASFSAESASSNRSIRVAKAADGHPALLLRTDSGLSSPIELRKLRVMFGVPCRVTLDEQVVEESLTVVECLSTDPGDHGFFLRAVGFSLNQIADGTPDNAVVSRAIDTLVELFRSLSASGRKTVQGLWGELFVIAASTDPAILVRAWHSAIDDRFDFAAEEQRIEVKTSATNRREHWVRASQVHQTGVRICIASLLMQNTGGGPSVEDLAVEVERRLVGQPELQLRLIQSVGDSLGDNWDEARRMRFDRQLALSSLVFFDGETLPRVPQPIPSEISELSYRVDLSSVRPLDLPDMRAAGDLWLAANPT